MVLQSLFCKERLYKSKCKYSKRESEDSYMKYCRFAYPKYKWIYFVYVKDLCVTESLFYGKQRYQANVSFCAKCNNPQAKICL